MEYLRGARPPGKEVPIRNLEKTGFFKTKKKRGGVGGSCAADHKVSQNKRVGK